MYFLNLFFKKTELNQFEPVFIQKTEPKPVGLNQFQFFLKKNRFNYFFYIKYKQKMITSNFNTQ